MHYLVEMIFYCQLVVRDVLFSVKSPITFYSIVCCGYFSFVIFFIPELLTNLRQSKVDLGCISLGKSEIGFLIQDHMDSLLPIKRKISFRIIFVTSHEIMLIYETMNRATKLC